jgi:hypothetical protein
MAKSLEERFWSKVDKRGPEECWPWTGAHLSNGYGSLGAVHGANQRGAHRVAFFVAHGHWPSVARHTCDNKWCVNAAHIVDGSHLDNSRDAVERGLLPGNGFKHWTHCKHGHEFTPENTYIRPDTGQRVCIKCKNLGSSRRREKITAAKLNAKAEETHCRRGHPWAIYARWQGKNRTHRYCRACQAERLRQHRARVKAASSA